MAAPRILVVEDDGLLALVLEELLEELGCEVAGSTASVAQTLDWLEAGGMADAALLDINLRGELAYPVAEAFRDRSLRFAFTTGYGETSDPRFPEVPVLNKPIRLAQLDELLSRFGLRG